jgi:DNA-binding transcriptional regulator PaaX
MNESNYFYIESDTLKFLLKLPLPLATLKHYLRSYNDRQIKFSLQRLINAGYVAKEGFRHHYLYSITDLGIDRLQQLEKEALEEDIQNEISKYLIVLNGAVDT